MRDTRTPTRFNRDIAELQRTFLRIRCAVLQNQLDFVQVSTFGLQMSGFKPAPQAQQVAG